MNINNYGFIFNDIQIVDNQFIKKAKNVLGINKINKEIEFYLYINKNNIKFPMPKLLNYSDGNLTIEYIYNSNTLINILNPETIHTYVNIIKQYLQNIHNIKISIPYNILHHDLNIEINSKIFNRYNEFDWENNSIYKSIEYVNNIKIKDIHFYCNIITNRLNNLLKDRAYYNIIHGDIHLGNILLDKQNMYFIDPRGYFGETKLYGLYEYDYAKLMFGISGYSIFDIMEINDIDIINRNIHIDFIKQYEYIFKIGIFDEITTLFCLSIWLGNNSCFSNINKKITSIMIAYYYCEHIL